MADRSQKALNTVFAGCELYNDAIGQEALARAGNTPQIKGIVHELLFRDQQNLGADGLIRGNVTQLSKNPTAHGIASAR
ncbi:MAG: hypothetical protein IJU76_11650 [Desulfovibrionaceae bacterium]|nr:hypothetical protein [Desulfovibrionaceae bacterium]